MKKQYALTLLLLSTPLIHSMEQTEEVIPPAGHLSDYKTKILKNVNRGYSRACGISGIIPDVNKPQERYCTGLPIYTLPNEDFESIDNFFGTTADQYQPLLEKIAKYRNEEEDLDISKEEIETIKAIFPYGIWYLIKFRCYQMQATPREEEKEESSNKKLCIIQ